METEVIKMNNNNGVNRELYDACRRYKYQSIKNRKLKEVSEEIYDV